MLATAIKTKATPTTVAMAPFVFITAQYEKKTARGKIWPFVDYWIPGNKGK